jgi:hypothetical protein
VPVHGRLRHCRSWHVRAQVAGGGFGGHSAPRAVKYLQLPVLDASVLWEEQRGTVRARLQLKSVVVVVVRVAR